MTTLIISVVILPTLAMLVFWYGDKPFIWLAIKMGWIRWTKENQ